jgi:PAS domain S-box-containing protein
LRESERNARSAFDGIAGLVSILAPNGEVEAANRQFLEYFGRSLEEIRNWETNDVLHPEDLLRVAELFKRAMAAGIPYNFELRLRRFDGEYRWFDTRGVPIRDDSGHIERWYNLLTDIEDRNEAIKEVLVLGRSAIIKNGVSVQTRLSEKLFPIPGDRVQLQQVVLNLVLNAVEAMGSTEAGARELLISTEQDQDHRGVLVAVRDSGPGIDPSHLERVFDAFYTTKSRGMGMGLSICRSIIEAHGGRLWAEANEPRGAIFRFTLPSVP